MRFIGFVNFGFLFLSVLPVYSQVTGEDTTLLLKEVIVTANRLENFSAGTKIQTIDSLSLKQNRFSDLSVLLANESPLFIKSYGLGSLASSSFRGGSASHTAVLWNGFNLNNPMYGQSDLALIPNNFINSVDIQYGGASALWGSGAVGGTVHLNNRPVFDNGLSIIAGSSFGSFSGFRQNVSVEISKQKWISSIKLFHNSAENNFPFYNTQLEDSPEQTQNNAELKQYGLLTENYFRINEKQRINVRYWYQFSDRNIPPTMLQSSGESNQKDESHRVTSEWQLTGKKIIYFVRAAYFDEKLVYDDVSFDEASLSRSQNIIAEAESKITINENHFINGGINNTFATAASDGYPDKKNQERFAVFASYSFVSENKKFRSAISVREEIFKNQPVPFTYSAGMEYQLLKWISLKGNFSSIYRIPTLNDLYWNPGGNPDLLPESGYSEELGTIIQIQTKNEKIKLQFEPTVFNRNITNWIIWLPGQSYWSPQNIMEVWSRGVETKSELFYKQKEFKLKLGVMTNYVVSTNEKAKTANDASVGKQLIYVPMYSGHGKITIGYKKLLFSFHQSYTGYRYTATDNSAFLKPYMLSNVHAAYNISRKKHSIDLSAQVNNLFNEQYQVMLNRAMPLRNFRLGITVQFNHANNKTK